jgi:hypothetical protein
MTQERKLADRAARAAQEAARLGRRKSRFTLSSGEAVMRISNLLLVGVMVIGLAGCDSGGVDLNVATTDNSVDNSTSGGGGSDNPCANYLDTTTNTTVRGSFDGTNCTYGADFVGLDNPLTVDLTIPFISGVHIFQDSLVVGQGVDSGAAPAGGTGPTLTIAAGNTLAFLDSADLVLINRGSSIIAEGSAAAPITFTGFTDAVTGTAGPEDVQLWGGIVINGNGITNNCTDAERAANQCHVEGEGVGEIFYGGNDNAESSGILRYVVVKHTGFEIAPGDELNGITFNTVGSGTVVENIETYSTFDDGIEFFGGAVNVTNYVALYAGDDSIDFSDGYVGTIQNALVIHSLINANRCVEGDNVGQARFDGGEPLDTAPQTKPIIRNLTCITSNVDTADGSFHGDSEGPLLRVGAQAEIVDSIIYGGYGLAPLPVNGLHKASNECFEVEGVAGDTVTKEAAAAGETTLNTTIIACDTEPLKGTLPNGDPFTDWALGLNPSTNGANYSFNTGNAVITDTLNANVHILEPDSFYTATALTDAAGTAITHPDAANGGHFGAVLAADDWTASWTFGLHSNNQAEPLWFDTTP